MSIGNPRKRCMEEEEEEEEEEEVEEEIPFETHFTKKKLS
jgi:hypothetical protein